jgi:hypothetical protein
VAEDTDHSLMERWGDEARCWIENVKPEFAILEK